MESNQNDEQKAEATAEETVEEAVQKEQEAVEEESPEIEEKQDETVEPEAESETAGESESKHDDQLNKRYIDEEEKSEPEALENEPQQIPQNESMAEKRLLDYKQKLRGYAHQLLVQLRLLKSLRSLNNPSSYSKHHSS